MRLGIRHRTRKEVVPSKESRTWPRRPTESGPDEDRPSHHMLSRRKANPRTASVARPRRPTSPRAKWPVDMRNRPAFGTEAARRTEIETRRNEADPQRHDSKSGEGHDDGDRRGVRGPVERGPVEGGGVDHGEAARGSERHVRVRASLDVRDEGSHGGCGRSRRPRLLTPALGSLECDRVLPLRASLQPLVPARGVSDSEPVWGDCSGAGGGAGLVEGAGGGGGEEEPEPAGVGRHGVRRRHLCERRRCEERECRNRSRKSPDRLHSSGDRFPPGRALDGGSCLRNSGLSLDRH